MEYKFSNSSDVDNWKEVILVYNSALKEIGTKLEMMNFSMCIDIIRLSILNHVSKHQRAL